MYDNYVVFYVNSVNFELNVLIFVNFVISGLQDLPARVHHSSPDHQRIRRECHLLKNGSKPTDCEFRKVITDVDTRWNSTYFLLKSIHLLRQALDSIRDGRMRKPTLNSRPRSHVHSPLRSLLKFCLSWRRLKHCPECIS